MRGADVGAFGPGGRMTERHAKQVALGLAALLVVLAITTVAVVSGFGRPGDASGALLAASGGPASPSASASAAASSSSGLQSVVPSTPLASSTAATRPTPSAKAPPTPGARPATGSSPPVEGDAIANALVITGIPYSRSLDTTGRQPARSGPDCGSGPAVWFLYRAGTSTRL